MLHQGQRSREDHIVATFGDRLRWLKPQEQRDQHPSHNRRNPRATRMNGDHVGGDWFQRLNPMGGENYRASIA